MLSVRAGSPDLYSIVEGGVPGFSDIPGRVQRTVPITGNVAVIVTNGQSDFGTHVGSGPYTPTNAANYNFSYYNERIYDCADPVLGASWAASRGSINGRIADNIINAGIFSSVITCPVSIAATLAADWAPGGAQSNRITVLLRRLSNAKIPATAICWMVGESDLANGTSQGAYTTSLNAVINIYRNAGLGTSVPFIVALYSGVSQTSNAIRSAQSAIVNHGSGIWAGPDIDAITNRLGDGHLNDTGAATAASGWEGSIRTALGL